jgi:hypothetical protein
LALSYLSSSLSEEEYMEQRIKQDKGTGRVTHSAITNAKLFCTDQFNRELIIVMKDIREEVERSHQLDAALIFLQKLITWMSEPHPHILMPKSAAATRRPFTPKDPDTIRGYVGQIRLYMRKVGGIPLTVEDVKDYHLSWPAPIEKEDAEPLTLDEFRIISDNQKSSRRMMLYRIMKDCEARIGAMVQLRKKHFDVTIRPIAVTFPKGIMKKKNGISFTNVKYVITEDEEPLLKLLAPLHDDDLVFGTNEDKELAVNTEEKTWNRLVQKLGFTEKYAHNGRIKKNIHSIKAMTFTAAEEAVDETFAHAYGDHARYTKTYLRWSPEKKIEKFRKLEALISPYTKFEIISDETLSEENETLRKKLAVHDALLEKLSEEKKIDTRQMPTDEIKKLMVQILQENNLL